MPRPSTAELIHPVAFPEQAGEPIWQERRALPVAAFFGVPLVFLAVGAVAAGPLALRALLAALVVAGIVVLVLRRDRALIETYALSDRFVTIEQRAGGRVAMPVAALTSVTIVGDQVRLEGDVGVVTFGYVRRQRALLRALERVAPALAVQRQQGAFCPT